MATTQPNATNTPHLISSNLLGYTDANGVAQQVTLKPLPAAGSTFGTDANGNPNNGARVNSDGSVTIFKDGTVIDGYNLSNGVVVQASNTVIKRCEISNGNSFGVNIKENTPYNGTLIEDCEIQGSYVYGIFGHDFTALRLNIHDIGQDGINASGGNGTVLDCYIHDLGTTPGAHADGIQISLGNGWVIRGNNIDLTKSANSAVFAATDFGSIDNLIIDGNWMDGGNYTVYSVDKHVGYGVPTNVVISNNFFGHNYVYGIAALEGTVGWTVNRWEDTNLLVNAGGSTSPGTTPVDTTAPSISSVVASPSTATLTTGNTVTLKVNFSEPVTVSSGGQPTLTLNNGGTANYVSGSGSTALTFSYAVAAGQDTADLAVTSLDLHGATIRDTAGNNAVRSGAATNPAGTLAIDTTPPPVTTPPPPVDTTRPTISSVVASPGTATLTTGNTVTLKVNFSEPVTVSSGGQPTLTLNNGGTANYVSGSGSTALTFSYAVAAGQDTADLAVTSLDLHGATIRDAAGNNAVRSGAATNPAGTLAIDTTPPPVTTPPPPVDTTRPTISSVVASPGTATLTTGNTVTLKVNFSEPVTVSSGGQPTLTLNNGGTANYVSGSGSTALTFSYAVAAGQDTADLAVTSLDLHGATIRDAAGNNAVRSGAATNPAGTLAIDTTPPPVTTPPPPVGGGGGHWGWHRHTSGSTRLTTTDIASSTNTTLGYSANSNNAGGTLTASDSTQAASIALLLQSTASLVGPADQSVGTVVQNSQSTTSTETLTQPHNGHHGWHN